MEAAVPHTLPPRPSPQMVAEARHRAANPQLFVHEPDFHVRAALAWFQLLADHWARIEARKAAQTIRSTFPEDAA
jgi:hypothetical protein